GQPGGMDFLGSVTALLRRAGARWAGRVSAERSGSAFFRSKSLVQWHLGTFLPTLAKEGLNSVAILSEEPDRSLADDLFGVCQLDTGRPLSSSLSSTTGSSGRKPSSVVRRGLLGTICRWHLECADLGQDRRHKRPQADDDPSGPLSERDLFLDCRCHVALARARPPLPQRRSDRIHPQFYVAGGDQHAAAPCCPVRCVHADRLRGRQ